MVRKEQRGRPLSKPVYSMDEDYSIDDEIEFIHRCECGELLHPDQGRICPQSEMWATWYSLH